MFQRVFAFTLCFFFTTHTIFAFSPVKFSKATPSSSFSLSGFASAQSKLRYLQDVGVLSEQEVKEATKAATRANRGGAVTDEMILKQLKDDAGLERTFGTRTRLGSGANKPFMDSDQVSMDFATVQRASDNLQRFMVRYPGEFWDLIGQYVPKLHRDAEAVFPNHLMSVGGSKLVDTSSSRGGGLLFWKSRSSQPSAAARPARSVSASPSPGSAFVASPSTSRGGKPKAKSVASKSVSVATDAPSPRGARKASSKLPVSSHRTAAPDVVVAPDPAQEREIQRLRLALEQQAAKVQRSEAAVARLQAQLSAPHAASPHASHSRPSTVSQGVGAMPFAAEDVLDTRRPARTHAAGPAVSPVGADDSSALRADWDAYHREGERLRGERQKLVDAEKQLAEYQRRIDAGRRDLEAGLSDLTREKREWTAQRREVEAHFDRDAAHARERAAALEGQLTEELARLRSSEPHAASGSATEQARLRSFEATLAEREQGLAQREASLATRQADLDAAWQRFDERPASPAPQLTKSARVAGDDTLDTGTRELQERLRAASDDLDAERGELAAVRSELSKERELLSQRLAEADSHIAAVADEKVRWARGNAELAHRLDDAQAQKEHILSDAELAAEEIRSSATAEAEAILAKARARDVAEGTLLEDVDHLASRPAAKSSGAPLGSPALDEARIESEVQSRLRQELEAQKAFVADLEARSRAITEDRAALTNFELKLKAHEGELEAARRSIAAEKADITRARDGLTLERAAGEEALAAKQADFDRRAREMEQGQSALAEAAEGQKRRAEEEAARIVAEAEGQKRLILEAAERDKAKGLHEVGTAQRELEFQIAQQKAEAATAAADEAEKIISEARAQGEAAKQRLLAEGREGMSAAAAKVDQEARIKLRLAAEEAQEVLGAAELHARDLERALQVKLAPLEEKVAALKRQVADKEREAAAILLDAQDRARHIVGHASDEANARVEDILRQGDAELASRQAEIDSHAERASGMLEKREAAVGEEASRIEELQRAVESERSELAARAEAVGAAERDLAQRKAKLGDENIALQRRIDSLEGMLEEERSGFAERTKSLEGEAQEARAAKDQIAAQLDADHRAAEEVSGELTELKRRWSDIEIGAADEKEKAASAAAQVVKLQSELDQVRARSDVLAREFDVERVALEKQAAEAEQRALESANEVVKHGLEQQADEVQRLRTEIAAAKKAEGSAKTQVSRSVDELASARAAHDKEVDGVRQAFDEKFAAAEEEFKARELKLLNENLSILAGKSALGSRMKAAEDGLSLARGQHALEVKKIKGEKAKELAELREASQAAQDEVERLKASFAAQKDDLEALQRRQGEFEALDDLVSARRDGMEKDREIALIDAGQLRSELHRTQQALDDANKRAADLEVQARLAQDTEVKRAGGELIAVMDQQLGYGKKFDEARRELGHANQERVRLSEELSAANRDNSMLRRELAAMKAGQEELEELRAQMARIQGAAKESVRIAAGGHVPQALKQEARREWKTGMKSAPPNRRSRVDVRGDERLHELGLEMEGNRGVIVFADPDGSPRAGHIDALVPSVESITSGRKRLIQNARKAFDDSLDAVSASRDEVAVSGEEAASRIAAQRTDTQRTLEQSLAREKLEQARTQLAGIDERESQAQEDITAAVRRLMEVDSQEAARVDEILARMKADAVDISGGASVRPESPKKVARSVSGRSDVSPLSLARDVTPEGSVVGFGELPSVYSGGDVPPSPRSTVAGDSVLRERPHTAGASPSVVRGSAKGQRRSRPNTAGSPDSGRRAGRDMKVRQRERPSQPVVAAWGTPERVPSPSGDVGASSKVRHAYSGSGLKGQGSMAGASMEGKYSSGAAVEYDVDARELLNPLADVADVYSKLQKEKLNIGRVHTQSEKSLLSGGSPGQGFSQRTSTSSRGHAAKLREMQTSQARARKAAASSRAEADALARSKKARKRRAKKGGASKAAQEEGIVVTVADKGAGVLDSALVPKVSGGEGSAGTALGDVTTGPDFGSMPMKRYKTPEGNLDNFFQVTARAPDSSVGPPVSEVISDDELMAGLQRELARLSGSSAQGGYPSTARRVDSMSPWMGQGASEGVLVGAAR